MGRHLIVDGCADVRPVQGVYPEDLAAVGVGFAWTAVIIGILLKDPDGEVLGEVVCAAGLLAGEVGDVVLSQDGLSVDGDEGLEPENAEVGFSCELASVPGFIDALDVGLTIIIDFHGVFLGLKNE